MRAVGMAERAMEESWMAGGGEGGGGRGRGRGREGEGEGGEGEGGGRGREEVSVSVIIEESYYNAPDLGLYVCLFSHKISTLQGIGSRRSMPVQELDRHVLRGLLLT